MELISLHNHTVFCDGKDSAEDFVRYALEDGATAIGFSGHSHLPFDESYCMTVESEKEYNREITRLKALYEGKIRIYRGIEAEYFGDSDLSDYEYVIGSAHFIKKDDHYLEIDNSKEIAEGNVKEFYGGDALAYTKDYYRFVIKSAIRKETDIVGHFDLVTKFNEDGSMFDENSKEYLDAAFGAFEEILPYDKIFEMNTGAMSRGYRKKPYIAENILRYMASHNARITVSADAHQKENYRYAFAETVEILKNAGIREVWEFNGKEFVPERL